MLLYFILGLGIVCATNSVASDVNTDDSDSYYPNQIWSDTFDWKLLKAYSSRYKNVLISPLSLKIVLALLYEGSSGTTEREFQSVLQFPSKQSLREDYRSIIQNLQPLQRTEYLLNIGTRIFLDSSIKPKQAFAAKAREFYQTDIEPTEFSHPENASNSINSWIEKLTNGKISHLVNPDEIQDAIMLITNAVYFKGTWRHQFPKNQTYSGIFYVTPTTLINVSYMSTTDEFFYHESSTWDASILRLPYKGNQYSLFIVLPASTGGLPDLIKRISLRDLHQQLYYLDKELVHVSIPKFKFNFQTRLSQTLQEFGLHQMFQNTASFPGIAIGNNSLLRMLVVSDIIQKTGIELDEEGSVVYASTDITIGNKIGTPKYVFNATQPFLFFIEEVTNGTILFVGKVENPLELDPVPLPLLPKDEYLQSAMEDENKPVGENESQFVPNVQNNLPNWTNAQDFGLTLSDNEKEAVFNRFNYFDIELLSEFSDTNENVLLSPASVKVNLAMILEGARGISALEIGEALRIPSINQKEIKDVLSTLLNNLNGGSFDSSIESSNAVFVNDKLKIVPEYKALAESFYKSLVKALDFSHVSNAVTTINSWVSNATRGAIQQLVDPQNINGDTHLVLANALYFKGVWQNAFDVKNTQLKCFRTPQGCVYTPMMRTEENFNYNYINKLSAHVIEIPYQGAFSMVILLPSEATNVRSLLRDLPHTHLEDILSSPKATDMSLEMPKFSFEYSTDLVRYLRILNIKEIFGPNANLSGIIKNDNIKIDNIVHKTKIDVDETGTVAAAATGAVIVPLMGSSTLIVDRPFVFFIFHKNTRNIIFEGILLNPGNGFSNNKPHVRPQQIKLTYPGSLIQNNKQQNFYNRG